ncbi:MAG: acetate--CoA ligase family protein [Deltaproteobacteria bacterium]|nr:acetate--CoA ligase family protein [Deltaproteobacteria bacterium]
MIVSPDTRTTRYLSQSIGKDTSCEVITTAKGFEKKIAGFIDTSAFPVLIIVPSEKMPFSIISMCGHCNRQHGLTLVWATELSASDDSWLLLKLLENEGAIVCDELDTLALIARIFSETRPTLGPFSTVHLADTKSAVMAHLANALQQHSTSGNSIEVPKIKMNQAAQIIFEFEKQSLVLDASPTVIGRAMVTLFCHFSKRVKSPLSLDIQPDAEIVQMIARPPARILSETTSKRLLGAFGLKSPNEMLCDSPSKAVRFARELGGPATLKLVRPNFLSRKTAGGVIRDVIGPSDIQKAYQSLMSLSQKMGGPKALGILVSEQIDTDRLYWLDAKKHEHLGRIIYFGKRSQMSEQPDGVITLPCSLEPCYDAVSVAFPTLTAPEIESFAQALCRFGAMCTSLDRHIGVSQIHPLALTDDGALMLDAVVGITDFQSDR